MHQSICFHCHLIAHNSVKLHVFLWIAAHKRKRSIHSPEPKMCDAARLTCADLSFVHIIVADDLLQISISSQFLQQKELKPTICKPPREKNQANENHD